MTRKQLLIGAAVLAVGGYAYARSRRLACGPGSTFKRATVADVAAYSTAVQDQVRRNGGYCVKTGVVSDYDQGLDGPVTDPGSYNP